MKPASEIEASRVTARIPDHVVYRGFQTETVMLNLATGQYHGVNPTGGRMLEALRDTPRIDLAAATVAEEFTLPPAKVEHDLLRFCESLAERGLVEIERLPQH